MENAADDFPSFFAVNSLIDSEKATIKTGWWFEPLWKILVNWDDYSQHMLTPSSDKNVLGLQCNTATSDTWSPGPMEPAVNKTALVEH